MLYILDKDGNPISKSKNLAGIKRYVSSSSDCIKKLDISEIGNMGEGKLCILFESGNSFECNFASFQVLANFVHNWKNAYDSPFSVNGEDKGKLTI